MGIFSIFCESIIKNIIDIALVIVGTSAFITYFLQKKNEKKVAATLILNQIDSIERAVYRLKENYHHNEKILNDQTVYLSNELEFSGAWDKYQHLIVKKMSQSECELMQRFFESACQIEKARADIVFSFKVGWECKALALSLMINKYRDPQFDNSESNADILLNEYILNTANTPQFTPQIAYNALYAELDNYMNLSGTTAYEKLQKMSFR